jgi:hypothetical protein
MSQSSAVPGKKPLLSDSVYNWLKHSAAAILPAVITLYVALAQVWHFPKVEETVTSLGALNTFLGVLLGVSTKQYNKSGVRYVGEIQVTDNGDKKTASLVVDGDPEDILKRSEATFRISDTGATPVVDR